MASAEMPGSKVGSVCAQGLTLLGKMLSPSEHDDDIARPPSTSAQGKLLTIIRTAFPDAGNFVVALIDFRRTTLGDYRIRLRLVWLLRLPG